MPKEGSWLARRVGVLGSDCHRPTAREVCVPDTPRYRVLQSLGKGGMGEVFLADDAQLGRKVALKLVGDAPADDGSVVGPARYRDDCCRRALLWPVPRSQGGSARPDRRTRPR